MSRRPEPELRIHKEEIALIGTMSIYTSQAEASQGIPHQWRVFLQSQPELNAAAKFYGASPCSDDRKIHYLTGVPSVGSESIPGSERLTLVAGEYAVVKVEDPSSLRDAWMWLLTDWLRTSGRQEKHAPEFERYTSLSEDGTPSGPVEIWIPLEPLAS